MLFINTPHLIVLYNLCNCTSILVINCPDFQESIRTNVVDFLFGEIKVKEVLFRLQKQESIPLTLLLTGLSSAHVLYVPKAQLVRQQFFFNFNLFI